MSGWFSLRCFRPGSHDHSHIFLFMRPNSHPAVEAQSVQPHNFINSPGPNQGGWGRGVSCPVSWEARTAVARALGVGRAGQHSL